MDDAFSQQGPERGSFYTQQKEKFLLGFHILRLEWSLSLRYHVVSPYSMVFTASFFCSFLPFPFVYSELYLLVRYTGAFFLASFYLDWTNNLYMKCNNGSTNYSTMISLDSHKVYDT